MKTRTMYMHTLDSRPASYAQHGGRPYVFFVGGRNKVDLVGSLRALQMQQRWAQEADRREALDCGHFEYGYVLVKVPA